MGSSASLGEPTTIVMAVPMVILLAAASQGRREGIDEGVFPHLSCDRSTSFPPVPAYLWYWET